MPPRLKSLELHGYKTFASRTLFEFPGLVTAVVGPNGSGKSNIADSLRWVLGEQVFSLLRGRKTEDMIFSGSELRPRSSMASATVIFDNGDGWLPIDFSEVAITRRAYRDGENEYLLNNQKVRLKEINELLSQSGLSERTYTVIGQGLVDAALSLKPDERRKFFEEAAGIGLYRARREESLNRLDATRRNLERVLDILSELTPRLQSLEKQAKKVQEYERIKADLRVLLRDWYGYHWHRTQKDLLQAREVVKVQEIELQKARERQAEVDAQINDLRGKMQSLRNELNGWHEQAASLHSQREQISKSLAVLEEKQHSNLDQKQTLEDEIVRLEEEGKLQQEQLASLDAEQTRLTQEKDEASAQLAVAEQNLKTRQVERSQAEDFIKQQRDRLVQAETKLVQSRARLDSLQGGLSTQLASQKSLEAESATTAQALSQQQARLDAVSKDAKTCEDEKSHAEDDLQQQRAELSRLEKEQRAVRERQAQAKADEARLKAQLDVVEQAERTFSGFADGARFVLEAAAKGKLPDAMRAISSQLEVPAEYETAVAAAMGENLDAIFIDAVVDPESVLAALESSEQGRAVLLPAAWAKQAEKIATPKGAAILARASEAVHCAPEYEPIVSILLGNAFIVRDRKEARQLCQHLPAHARVITLRGEVFTGSGMVLAGKEGRAGRISRPREKKDLQEKLSGVESTLSDFEKQLSETEQLIKQQNQKVEACQAALKAAEQKQAKASQEVHQISVAVESSKQKSEWLNRQKTEIQNKIAAANGEMDAANKLIKTLEEETGGYREQIRDSNAKLASLPAEELQAQVVHWRTSLAVSSQATDDANRRIAERRQMIHTNETRHSELTARLEEMKTASGQLVAEQEKFKTQENEIAGSIENLRNQIDPAELQLKQQDTEFNRLQDVQLSIRQIVSVADRHATQAQLELTRQKEALDSLRRRVEEDFGLVAFEYSGDVSGQTPLPLDGMVEQLPVVPEIPKDLEENISRQRSILRRLGPVNMDAQHEFEEVQQRFTFLSGQVEDLKKADLDLRQVIAELDEMMKTEFRKTFDAVAIEFHQMFTRLFGGGTAKLILTDAENPTETGVDIEARLPGRREQGLSLLSGGERSLTAVALIFSLLKVSPTPFCILDEVDAMLDEANVGRFCELLQELSQSTQFILITHNRNTVQVADVIYGVTMGKDTASQVISLKMDEISDDMVK
ncbi:MAG: chromosome segregation protein SMC [Anaerolineaceae bacterium]|jgi:chromosome segregation protein